MDTVHSVMTEWAISTRIEHKRRAVVHGMRCYNQHVIPICRIPTVDWDFFVHDVLFWN